MGRTLLFDTCVDRPATSGRAAIYGSVRSRLGNSGLEPVTGPKGRIIFRTRTRLCRAALPRALAVRVRIWLQPYRKPRKEMAALAATTNAASGRGRWWVGLSPSCGDRNVNRLLKRHEKSVFVFLVVGGKSVLMNQD